jgi:glucose/arabinose dehydrogenase
MAGSMVRNSTSAFISSSQAFCAFVALHGSWNRSLHTGYKIVRLPFKDDEPTGEYQDFVIGFTAGEHDVWGRPVGVAFVRDGAMLFSDDGNGVVYRVSYKAK